MEVPMAEAILSVKHRGGSGVIEPLPTGVPSLEGRLRCFDPERHGGEGMAAAPIGAEKW